MDCECLRSKAREAAFELSQLHDNLRSDEPSEDQLRDEEAQSRMNDEGCPDQRPPCDSRKDAS